MWSHLTDWRDSHTGHFYKECIGLIVPKTKLTSSQNTLSLWLIQCESIDKPADLGSVHNGSFLGVNQTILGRKLTIPSASLYLSFILCRGLTEMHGNSNFPRFSCQNFKGLYWDCKLYTLVESAADPWSPTDPKIPFLNFSYAYYDNMISSSIKLARKSVAEFAEHACKLTWHMRWNSFWTVRPQLRGTRVWKHQLCQHAND